MPIAIARYNNGTLDSVIYNSRYHQLASTSRQNNNQSKENITEKCSWHICMLPIHASLFIAKLTISQINSNRSIVL